MAPTATARRSPETRRPPHRLARGEVHVWHVPLDCAGSRVAQLLNTLGERERARSRRFRFAQDRRRYVVMRGTLRTILGRYLDVAPEGLRLDAGAHGKPALADAPLDVRFNVTHAGAVGLVGVALEREVGIDVEGPLRKVEPLSIALHFFAPAELARLRSLPAADRERAFLECWTRKEAYAKALGLGLHLPLDSFEVGFGPGAEPSIVVAREPAADDRRFAVVDVPAPAGYVASLVVEKLAAGERFARVGTTTAPLVYRADGVA